MGGYGEVQMIDENGVRADGRGPGDIRPITIETGVVPVADGSCRMTWGLMRQLSQSMGRWRPIPGRYSGKIVLFWM